jgi:hypothetical protein
MPQISFRDPRHKWALMELETDPFVAAVWNCDQVLKPDHLPDPWPAMFLRELNRRVLQERATGVDPLTAKRARQQAAAPAAA